MSKTDIKVKVNYPEDEEEMRIFKEIQVSRLFETLKDMIDKDGLKLLENELNYEDVV